MGHTVTLSMRKLIATRTIAVGLEAMPTINHALSQIGAAEWLAIATGLTCALTTTYMYMYM